MEPTVLQRLPHSDVVLPSSGPWWWACAEPERPHDVWAVYLDQCSACQIALAALAHRTPDATMERRDGDDARLLYHGTAAGAVAATATEDAT